MAIAKKILDFSSQASWIRRMFEDGLKLKAKFGSENVYDFTLGNPDLEPPGRFREVLLEVAADSSAGKHAYMPNAGYPETRKAVASFCRGYTLLPCPLAIS